MNEKYFYITPEKARELLSQATEMNAAKRGVDSSAFLIDEYAVLTTRRLKLRNVTTRDDDLSYLDELIHTLMSLREQGVAVVPILGYSYDPDSRDGVGYIIQQRAKGEELYDDAIMSEYYSWTQSGRSYLLSYTDTGKYVLSRTNYLSKAPQRHFDKFVSDITTLINNDILIDFNGKSNFFYDGDAGFQFIDLDSHTDYKYGLTTQKPDGAELSRYYGFTPCHTAVGSKVFAPLALDEKAVSKIGENGLQQLTRDNRAIFEKCKTALLNNGNSEEQVNKALETVKIFGY
jgi:hypothetical protein